MKLLNLMIRAELVLILGVFAGFMAKDFREDLRNKKGGRK